MNDLVKGFVVQEYEGTRLMETKYAETKEGKFYEGLKLPFSNYFLRPNDVWREVEGIPAHAEYIGTYPHPKI